MKKNTLLITLLLTVCFVSILFAACTPESTEPITYTVTFDSQGGSDVASQVVDSGNLAALPTTPTKSDFTLSGWYKTAAANNADKWNFDTDRVTGNMTLYAGWTSNGSVTNYIVTFDSQGGSDVASQSIASGNPVILPTAPTKSGFTLSGWYKTTAANSTDKWNFDTDRVTGPMILYAGWTPVESQEPTASLTYQRVSNTSYTVTGVGDDEAIIIPAIYQSLPVRAIGEAAFARKAITSVVIPDSVTTIGLNAFNNCSNLVTITIGQNSWLTSIGNNAFSGNGSLQGIYIPSNVTTIGDSAFNNCGSLNTISVAEANTVYSGAGNNLIEKATNTLIRGSNNSVIPASVTTIALAAFRRANGMTELVIPATVLTIGNYFIADSTIITVRFQGTQAQWEAVGKTSFWNYGNRDVSVICTDDI